LKYNGLRTKDWSQRSQSVEAKEKMSQQWLGKRTGADNPNYGDKPRPWLEGEAHPLRVWHRENPDFGKNQRGANNPIHKVKGLYENPEYVARITRGIREHTRQKSGSTYEVVYGAEKAAEYREKLRLASPARMAKYGRHETGPELAVRKILVRLGKIFIPQAPLGYYTVDFLVVGDPLLVIQADGDYWHAHPQKYTEANLSAPQRKQRRLDASCNSYLKNRGYRVLRLWECDLKTSQDDCEKQILRALGET
jgi:DNA mismatch endonuclease (patch repair protein)